MPRRKNTFGWKPPRRRRNNSKPNLMSLAFLAILFLGIVSVANPTVGLTLVLLIGVPLGLYAYYKIQTSRKADHVLFEMGVRSLENMNGIEFEKFLKSLFMRLGYSVNVTQASSDYGVDLILKNDWRKIAVQAKRYEKPVSLKAVQEVRSGMDFYNTDEGWVVTNSTFTKSANDLAVRTGIRLVDGDKLRELIASTY